MLAKLKILTLHLVVKSKIGSLDESTLDYQKIENEIKENEIKETKQLAITIIKNNFKDALDKNKQTLLEFYYNTRMKETKRNIEAFSPSNKNIDWILYFNTGASGHIIVYCNTCKYYNEGTLSSLRRRVNGFCNKCVGIKDTNYIEENRLLIECQKRNYIFVEKIDDKQSIIQCNICKLAFDTVNEKFIIGTEKCPNCVKGKTTYNMAIEYLTKSQFTLLTKEEDFKHGKCTDIYVECDICLDIFNTRIEILDQCNGRGCAKCAGNKRLNFDEVKQELLKRDIIILTKKYTNINTSYEFKYMKCTYEWKNSLDHIKNGKQGCKQCAPKSKAEEHIRQILNETFPNIKYRREYKFDDCVYKDKLPFDFYIEEINLLIETDGEQHFDDREYFRVDNILEKDKIKTQYAINNKINLLRFSYKCSDKQTGEFRSLFTKEINKLIKEPRKKYIKFYITTDKVIRYKRQEIISDEIIGKKSNRILDSYKSQLS